MAIMVGNGAQAGALSPFAPTGIIVTGLMDKIGLAGSRVATYAEQPAGACGGRVRGYFALRRLEAVQDRFQAPDRTASRRTSDFFARALDHAAGHRLVLIVRAFFDANVGMAAFTGAAVLSRCASPITRRRSAGCRGRRS